MSNTPTVYQDSSEPLIVCQAALNGLLRKALSQTSARTQAAILRALANGARLLLSADLTDCVYRFSLEQDGRTVPLCTVLLPDDENDHESEPEVSH